MAAEAFCNSLLDEEGSLEVILERVLHVWVDGVRGVHLVQLWYRLPLRRIRSWAEKSRNTLTAGEEGHADL